MINFADYRWWSNNTGRKRSWSWKGLPSGERGMGKSMGRYFIQNTIKINAL
jgi:hypothetical protein